MADVVARAPRWAIEAGLPEPTEGEMLRDYCERIGIDYAPLVEGIKDERALDCANIRLGHVLRTRAPRAWRDYISSLMDEW